MQEKGSLTRREFLGKTTLLASAAYAAAGAKKVRAQLNNAAVPPPARLGVGFIGVGVRGTELLEASRKIYGIDIVAACDLYKGHLTRALELTESKLATTGKYEELLARQDIDAVVAAVPDHQHKRILLDSLQAGKHVYIEKPLTHKLEEGEEMVRAVEKSKKVVQVGSQTLSDGCVGKAADLIRSGKLGTITMVEGQMLRYSSLSACYYPIPPDASPETVDWKRFIGDAPWREFDPKRFFQWRLFWDYSGGLTTDLFVHMISATHYMMGVQEPESAFGFSDIYYWKNYREVPDQICAMVTYPQGFVLKLTTTVNNGHPVPMLTFYGTEGTLEYNGDWMKYYYEPRREKFSYATHSWATETVKLYKDIMGLNDDQSPLTNPPPRAAEPMEFRARGGDDSDTAHLRNFYDGIRTGSTVIENIRFGANAVRVAHMINISCKSGKAVRWNAKTGKVEV
ncbi:MAG TPA: Gfo/Idh/MocA family oxidoreductase [archaeon]|nr:Gfo/Idh/MocA family oxidoreductase [archaeon]